MSKDLEWKTVATISKERIKDLYDKSMANRKEEDKMSVADFTAWLRSYLEVELKNKMIEYETNLYLNGHN